MTTVTLTFNPLDPAEAHAVMTMCAALHGLSIQAPSPPRSPRPEQPADASSAAGTGGAASPTAPPDETLSAPYLHPDPDGSRPNGLAPQRRCAERGTIPTNSATGAGERSAAPGENCSSPAPTLAEPVGGRCLNGRGNSWEAEGSPTPSDLVTCCDGMDAPADAAIADPAPEPDWDALIARVVGGESVRDVARSVGVSGQRLGGKVAMYRRYLPASAAAMRARASSAPDAIEGPLGPDGEPRRAVPMRKPADWAAILDRAETGERPDEIADDTGVDLAELQERLRRRLIGRAREKAEADAKRKAATADDEWDSFWTPARDLKLTQTICTVGISTAAATLQVSRDDAKRRWTELMPRNGLPEQTALLKRLQAEVAEAAS